ncbi:hypothetical protein H6F86_20435 [Phormidium sp. FACHB-592]|uniref:Uncharacterized protein n=1 Tax=Stenomitos frigidus AS-A4 TaxID=2933935 RepID=A0ABV0KEH7_9CYAN|nr:hypothetical protein [Phormidium sp. FACHB-592]MBD2076200.1 hypothetical protein [Phormidium sp. FACHB-592]
MANIFPASAGNIPGLPAMQVQRTGFIDGKPGFVTSFSGRRSGNSFNASGQTDVVEFVLNNNRIPLLAGNQSIEIISTSASDSALGSGVRTVELVYLDAAYNLQKTTVTLNGILAVSVQKDGASVTPQAIWWMHTLTAGTGLTAAGNIILRIAGAGAELEQITSGGNMSLSARCAVPLGYDAYIPSFFGSAVSALHDFRFRATVSKLDVPGISSKTILEGIYNFQGVLSVREGDNAMRDMGYLRLPEKTRIKISTIAGAATAQCDASFPALFVKRNT